MMVRCGNESIGYHQTNTVHKINIENDTQIHKGKIEMNI